MAVDNPSYFSLAGGTSSPTKTTTTRQTSSALSKSHGSGFSAFFRRKPGRMGATSSSGTLAAESNVSSMHHENHSSASGTSTPSTPTEEQVPMLSRNDATHSACSKRRSFRNLFRSVSANANHETTQQFLKGDPRPSDIAPPSPYLPHRSHSHSENDRHRPGRKVLKSTSELLANDMVYCGLTGKNRNGDNNDTQDDDDDDTAEVFLGINDARYYNLSSTLPTPGSSTAYQRRHSIGTFLRKEAGTSGNVVSFRRQQAAGGSKSSLEPDTRAAVSVPNDDIDGICRREERQTSYNRNRRRKHRNSTKRGSHSTTLLRDGYTEDDILFVSNKESEASNLWVNYLTACFEQISRQQGRASFKVRHIAIEEPIAPRTEEKIRSSRLQIIVICPILLEYIQTHSEHVIHLTSCLITDRVLVMMLGVQENHVSLNETYRSSLISYDQWKKFFVKDQDETFVGELLGAAIRILGTTPPSSVLKSDKTAFSVHPKKVKLGQNKVIVLLNDPLSSEDNVSVIVDRCGEAINISNVKRRNPYALQFSIPERCLDVSMLIGVRIFKNGRSLGGRQVKCESRLRELDQILRAHDNPLEFMCQTFGFSSSNREQLDNWMVHAFQKNIPSHFNLLSTPSGMVPAHKNQISSEENPTLLHFAARFGLEKLAWQLLECPGSDLACDLRNASELTPADLAEQARHMRLAHQLRGYMQMNEFTNMYSYVKVMSETAPNQITDGDVPLTVLNETNNDKGDYCRPRPLSEAYLVPPIARPITTLIPNPQITTTTSAIIHKPLTANYSIVPTPTPVIFPSGSISTSTISNGLDLTIQGYMKMHPTGQRTPTASISSLSSSQTVTPTQNIRQDCHQSSPVPREDNCNQKISQNTLYGRTTSNGSCRSRESSGPQDELLEIINDFKNNVFTISEVERLVENWQKRNDVQQSFKDKQRQLVAMREEYERIQKKMKEEMKTPTPFDKIRRFFSKGKKDIKESANVVSDSSSTDKSEGTSGTSADRRPISSLSFRSVSSSSSSGRMSTVSGCSGTSFGDSGTHSDSDDRRLQNMRVEKGGIMSYEIPPTPKPFTGRYSPATGYPLSLNISTTRNLDLRQRQSPSRTGKNEYYIAFPPSGLPVHAFKADGSLKEPNTPSSPCEHPKYLDFVQHVDIPTDKNHEEAETMRLVNNSYINIEPLASNSAPNSPVGLCVLHSNNELSSTDPLHVDQEIVKNATTEANDVPTTCSNISKMKPLVIEKTAIDEIDSALSNQDQKDTEEKCNQGYATIDSTNILKTINEVTERKVPDYMNVTVNIDHNNIKILGAIPKRLHGPPVPPRGTSLNNV